jgi:dTDP-4-dehydrorhamnose reductase
MAAARAGAWVVQISTDYVFDGRKRSPYVESDPPSPLSRYGSSKLAGEDEVAARCPNMHTIARTSWLFGTGRCFPSTIVRLAAERDELTVVDDQVGCPTFTGHLANALLELIDAQSPPLGIVHLAAAGSCSWYEFAREVLASSGSRCELLPGDTADLGRPAPRPAYSVLDTELGAIVPRLPDWREGVAAYMSAGMPTV